MHKILVLCSPEPTDRAAFEEYYVNRHLPMAAKLPGLKAALIPLGVPAPGIPAPGPRISPGSRGNPIPRWIWPRPYQLLQARCFSRTWATSRREGRWCTTRWKC